jgi:EmrB/QacA subfamily drug resistance transporter
MTFALATPCDHAVVATAPAPQARRSLGTERWTLAATILGSSLAFIDSTVVNVSLPALAHRFNASAAAVQWVVIGYALPLSALVLTGGAFSDRFGSRKVFSIGVLLFAITSTFCAAAQSLPQLLVARVAQGSAAALLVPSSLALLGVSFPEAQLGRAIGTWSAFASLTAAIGPLLGGWLIDRWSWRSAFLINVPLAAATLVIVAACVPAPAERPRGGRIDVAGAIAITLALCALTAALTLSSTNGGNRRVAAMLGVTGMAAIVLFLAIESRTDHPMTPLGIWRSSTFASLNALTFVVYAALAMLMFELPSYLIDIKGYTATAAAAAMLPVVAEIFSLSGVTGAWASRAGPRTPLTLGGLLVAAGFAWLALSDNVFPGIVTLGLGMAMIVAPLTTAVMTSLDTGHAGLASGVNNAVARVAGLFGVAVLGTIAHARSAYELAVAFPRVMIVATVLGAIGAAIATRLPGFDEGSRSMSTIPTARQSPPVCAMRVVRAMRTLIRRPPQSPLR